MSYPLRKYLKTLVVSGKVLTSVTHTDDLGNVRPITDDISLQITLKSSKQQQYFRALAGKTDPRLPYECYVLDAWKVSSSGEKIKYHFDLGKLEELLTFSTGTLSIYNKSQINLTQVKKIFGIRFEALLDGTLPEQLI